MRSFRPDCLSTVVLLLPMLLLGGVFSGCTGPNHPERVANTTSGAVRAKLSGIARDHDDLVQYRSRGPIDVVVDSFGGDVVLVADPDFDVTSIQLIREAHHGYLRGFEPEEALKYLSWNSRLDPGPGPVETLSIETTYTGPEPWYMRAHLRIQTPQLDRVRVRTTRGRVYVRNNTGPVDVETNLGDVIIATNHPQKDQMRILVSEGDVDYRVPGGSTGLFDVAVVDGDIEMRITEDQMRFTEGRNNENALNARLGDGKNPVMLRTTEGTIRIAVVEYPLEFGPWR
ncbi:MAG: hypothetical protein CBC35_05255 [Planctomycetes bacterium TMED75]|nr:hypothetical protein [Planctomycetaceae bacterium]OUU93606.1 MAG: hypothetical protein CBC35_05255 [Planctomycetes bacterium TMED75]